MPIIFIHLSLKDRYKDETITCLQLGKRVDVASIGIKIDLSCLAKKPTEITEFICVNRAQYISPLQYLYCFRR